MRYNEILNEFLIKLDGITIHRNPIKPQVLNMMKQSKSYGDDLIVPSLRGLIIAGKIYIWDIWDGIHYDILDAMIKEGFLDEDERRNYSGFYLYIYQEEIKVRSFHTSGITDKRFDRAILNKYIDRWNS